MHQKVGNVVTNGNTGRTRSLIRQEKRKRLEDGKDAIDNAAQFHVKFRGKDRSEHEDYDIGFPAVPKFARGVC